MFVNDDNVAFVYHWSQQVRMVCGATGTTPVEQEMVDIGCPWNLFETVLQMILNKQTMRKLCLQHFKQVERVA